MSLKSFDKFCEHIIMDEPQRGRAVYDERQKVIRLRNTAICLGVYSGLAFLNTLFFDIGWRWCESGFAALVLFVPVCAALFFILCAANGALFDVKGTRAMKYYSTILCAYGVLYSVMFFPSEERPVLVDGVLSEDFIMLLADVAMLVQGAVLLIACAREDKRAKAEKDKQD